MLSYRCYAHHLLYTCYMRSYSLSLTNIPSRSQTSASSIDADDIIIDNHHSYIARIMDGILIALVALLALSTTDI